MRLQKYVSDCGLMSRRAAEKEIEAGSFTVNGEVAVIGQQIEPEKDIIKYKGTRVGNIYRQRNIKERRKKILHRAQQTGRICYDCKR